MVRAWARLVNVPGTCSAKMLVESDQGHCRPKATRGPGQPNDRRSSSSNSARYPETLALVLILKRTLRVGTDDATVRSRITYLSIYL